MYGKNPAIDRLRAWRDFYEHRGKSENKDSIKELERLEQD